MAETTKIEWADSTLNVWEGCQETASPACVGCYARERNLRYAPKGTKEAPNWGPHAQRREVKSWRATLRKISRRAAWAFAFGRTEPWFVFVNSLSDFWDNQADPKLRAEALAEFRKHPHLTFLLLTKRPQNIVKLFRQTLHELDGSFVDDGAVPISDYWPRNVAIGCTVVTQAEADRDVPWLLAAKAALNPAFAFLSMEPPVEVVDLTRLAYRFNGAEFPAANPVKTLNALTGRVTSLDPVFAVNDNDHLPALDWIITGGGTDQGKHKAYPTPIAAFRKVRDDCAAAGVPYLLKQWGEWTPGENVRRKRGRVPVAWWFNDQWQYGEENLADTDGHVDDEPDLYRVGKKAAGRMLDGRTHDDRPKVRHG
ncbi:DUF5131 family protein [Phenylobacterium sp.]|uniref:DUF5131 family protein n=1 Tax=Phenylobacterium sp. TaxID=1871053 RepID=UPI00391B2331